MKDFSLFGSESKEGSKNIESTNDRTVNLFRPEVLTLLINKQTDFLMVKVCPLL